MLLITHAWTSAADFSRTGDFYWDTTGEAIGPYLHWGPDEPNNLNSTEHCVIVRFIIGSYKWADDYCTYTPIHL